MKRFFILFIFLALCNRSAKAISAHPMPIPEDPSTEPQIELNGAGIATMDVGRASSPGSSAKNIGIINDDDSSLSASASQRLYDGGIGSFTIGTLTVDQAAAGTGSPLFLNQAVLDYQEKSYEIWLGLTDNPAAHLVDFPTLRADDLVTFTSPLNPYSNGQNTEDHLYSKVAAITFNQNLTYYENFHVQQLIDTVDAGSDPGVTSAGFNFEYRGPPGYEHLQFVRSAGFGYEHVNAAPSYGGINQVYAGGVINLKPSVTNLVDLRAQGITMFGSKLNQFSSVTDSFQADYNAMALSLRYLHSPFGKPASQIALTLAAQNYIKVSNANSYAIALTGVKRLGQGVDLIGQLLGQWRSAALEAVQSPGVGFEQIFQVGLDFNFDTIFNQHIGPRRTYLNYQHQYIPE